MLYYFVALLATAVILLINHSKSEVNRWAAFFLTAAAIGGLSDVLVSASRTEWSRCIELLNHTLTPYGVIIFSIVYAERLITQPRMRFIVKLLLLIPVIVTMIVTLYTHEMRINYVLLLIWSAPYYLTSCYVLIVSYLQEENRARRRNRFIIMIIMVPTLLAVILLINVANVISPNFDFFQYIYLFIVYSLSVAVLCTFLYGVLGVKLRFEQDPLESTMKVVSSGTTLLNHTIKNEIAKIAISSENLKSLLPVSDQESLQHLHIIANASDHMLAMVNRIHSQMKYIELNEQPVRLHLLVNEQIAELRQLMHTIGSLHISTSYNCQPIVRCDPVHMKEVIGNILKNALEAMPAGGELLISLDEGKRGIKLSIQDNGHGIAEGQLAHVFDPFYSTKNQVSNFGLGLSYVYNVMQRSGGSVEITSRENEGTTITLSFARRNVLDRNV